MSIEKTLIDKDWQLYQSELNGDERCGVVLNDGTIVELPNRSSSPSNSFSMLESDFEPYREQAIATWHTHPRGPNNLSIDDYNTFVELEDYYHLILTHQSISLYKTIDGHVMNIARRKFDV